MAEQKLPGKRGRSRARVVHFMVMLEGGTNCLVLTAKIGSQKYDFRTLGGTNVIGQESVVGNDR